MLGTSSRLSVVEQELRGILETIRIAFNVERKMDDAYFRYMAMVEDISKKLHR